MSEPKTNKTKKAPALCSPEGGICIAMARALEETRKLMPKNRRTAGFEGGFSLRDPTKASIFYRTSGGRGGTLLLLNACPFCRGELPKAVA